MYTPKDFKIENPETLIEFIRRHSFATIISHDGSVPHATHMPVLHEPSADNPNGKLVTHLARANPQWRHFENQEETLVIFTGPHAYISPAWYETTLAVPTWNYTAVHVYGKPRVVDDQERFATILSDLVEFHEKDRPARWDAKIPEAFRDKLMKAIVGIEIPISRIEGKFKLNQNRPDDMPNVIAALESSADQTDREVAQLMQQIADR